MAKARRGPALFELLDRDNGSAVSASRAPRWWTRRPRETSAATPDWKEGALGVPPAGRGPERLLDLDGDRVRISLTSAQAALAIFLTLAVAASAYLIGSQKGDRTGFARGFETGRAAARAPEDEITAARSQPPATHLLTPLVAKTGPEPAAAPARVNSPTASAVSPPTGWIRDLTYIVVQEFPAGAADRARSAQQFLAERGVEAEAVTMGNGGIHLIAVQGYNHRDPGQKKLADQLLTKIRTIGSQYYAAGGGYKLEGYYKTLKRDRW